MTVNSRYDYGFDGRVSRSVLENYLSRSITMMRAGNTDDNNRMLINTGAKFIGRVAGCWGGESTLPQQLPELEAYARRLHALDPEIILQACIFEIVSRDISKTGSDTIIKHTTIFIEVCCNYQEYCYKTGSDTIIKHTTIFIEVCCNYQEYCYYSLD